MAEKPIIEVQGLTKRFKGLTAVHDVSLSRTLRFFKGFMMARPSRS